MTRSPRRRDEPLPSLWAVPVEALPRLCVEAYTRAKRDCLGHGVAALSCDRAQYIVLVLVISALAIHAAGRAVLGLAEAHQ